MSHFDVFNGDADGMCALVQLRLEAPRDATLVTGIKRDIELLRRVPAQAGDSVTVLDISLAVNRAPLDTLLSRGVTVEYFDHHYAGSVPSHPRLTVHIDTAPDACTGILVDRYLSGRRRAWAVAAAFGDDLHPPARALARSLGLTSVSTAALRLLGEALGYNAYGDRERDLLAPPVELYRAMLKSVDPWSFVASEPALRRIVALAREDLALARGCVPYSVTSAAAVYLLPDAAWSRRVRGRLSNALARRDPSRAHAVLVPDDRDGYTVSLRAPRSNPFGADALCRCFAGGGGRAAAAGINHLPAAEVPALIAALERLGEPAAAVGGTKRP